MIKKLILTLSVIFLLNQAKAQQYSLFNTKTLFDAFENPAVKAFTLDSSSRFASNFLLPNFGLNGSNNGSANHLIRKLINERVYDSKLLPLGSGGKNTLNLNSNFYLLTFRIFSSYKYNQEIGFAWQVRSDVQANYTNETLGILQNYKHFSNIPYDDVLNNNAYQQSYHQFSISIRENLNKKLAFGLKISALSGIAYNSAAINSSSLLIDATNDRINASLNGTYKASFSKSSEIDNNTILPTFKNPGLSLSFGTTYNTKSGFYMMANIKDLGFINWKNTAYVAKYGFNASIANISSKSNSQITDEITNNVIDTEKQQNFVSPTNAKADFLISKTFNFYKPSIIISKNLIHKGGDLAWINTFTLNSLAVSVTPTYNFSNFLMVGLQGMYQTPNFEFFLGTDNIGKTTSLIKGFSQADASIGSGHIGASFYMGVGIKFGKTVYHPQNLSVMPGVNGEKTYNGVFRSLYRLFKKS